MIERILIVVILAVAGVAIYLIQTHQQIKRVNTFDQVSDPILSRLKPGVPAVVYFTTPGCIPCKTQQQPALAQLMTELGETGLQVIQVDATQEPDSADRWGVFSAPTTFILDSTGKTRTVNYGVADTYKLRKQLETI